MRNDNRIENLRECTSSENKYNSNIRKTNKSGTKCGHWHKARSKWCAQIHINSVTKYLGVFEDKDEAIRVANMARKKHHGEFARS